MTAYCRESSMDLQAPKIFFFYQFNQEKKKHSLQNARFKTILPLLQTLKCMLQKAQSTKMSAFQRKAELAQIEKPVKQGAYGGECV